MNAFHVRRLAASDLRDGFDAGSDEGENRLTEFFQKYALQHQRRRLSVTWVAMDGTAIAGYVTLCPGAVSADDARKSGAKVGRHPAPVLLLARMATAIGYRKQGVGRRLLDEAVMPQAERLATEHGCIGIFTEAKPQAISFYAKHKFVALGEPSDQGNAPMLRLLER